MKDAERSGRGTEFHFTNYRKESSDA
jgi:hypothetical protein